MAVEYVLPRCDRESGLQRRVRPTAVQQAWLRRGLEQPGGKLPLFDEHGQRYSARTIRSCIDQGWAEPWFNNPIKPDWLVCRLTEAGREASLWRCDPANDEEEPTEAP